MTRRWGAARPSPPLAADAERVDPLVARGRGDRGLTVCHGRLRAWLVARAGLPSADAPGARGDRPARGRPSPAVAMAGAPANGTKPLGPPSTTAVDEPRSPGNRARRCCRDRPRAAGRRRFRSAGRADTRVTGAHCQPSEGTAARRTIAPSVATAVTPGRHRPHRWPRRSRGPSENPAATAPPETSRRAGSG
jgi:hypothetical protein